MDGMEEKLNTILNNPQMMQQIMSLANSMNTPREAPTEETNRLPDIDPGLIQNIMSIAGKIGADANQQALLSALSPYLKSDRLQKLEKAMRAAKLASVASTALNNGTLSFLTGR